VANLYVRIDETSREKLTRKISGLSGAAGYFATTQASADFVQLLLDTLFLHGMPMTFQAANLSLEAAQGADVLLALRPVLERGREWPFPQGRSLVVRGIWSRKPASPV